MAEFCSSNSCANRERLLEVSDVRARVVSSGAEAFPGCCGTVLIGGVAPLFRRLATLALAITLIGSPSLPEGVVGAELA